MLHLKSVPTTDVETAATPTRSMSALNLAAAIFGIAFAAGWDGLIPPATGTDNSDSTSNTVARISSSGTP